MTYSNIITGACLAALLGSATFGLSSCQKEFIDLSDPTRILTEQGYSDSLSIVSGVTAAYASLQDIYGKAGSNNGLYVFSEIPSDNATTVVSGQALNEFDTFAPNPNNPRIQSQWVATYRAIGRCNIILSRAPAVRLTANTRNRYLAEVKFIRALAYFNAVRIWGDIPKVTTEITSIADAYAYGRAPVAEIYALVEQDLKDAIDALPVSYASGNDLGRATKGAAQGLLGKVYLTERKYADAATVLKTLIDANTYALQPTYASIFLTSNEMNSEIISAVRYTKGGFGVGSPFANNFAVSGSFVGNIGTSDQFFSVTRGLVDEFTASGTNDVRAAASYGTTTLGSSNTVYYTKKYTDVPTTSGDGENDWIVLRYADVLLMYAEAVNEQGSITPAALDAANRVIRRSCNLPVATANPTVDLPAAITQDVFRARLELERRLELNMEGHRWFDLVRTPPVMPSGINRGLEVMTAFFARYGGRPATAPALDAHNLVFPLPIQELQTNSLLTQNPGYN